MCAAHRVDEERRSAGESMPGSRRRDRHPGRHTRPRPGSGQVPRSRPGGGGRAASLRGPPTRNAGRESAWHAAPRALDDRHADPPHPQSSCSPAIWTSRSWRAAKGPDPDHHPAVLRPATARRPTVWCARRCEGPPGVRDLPSGRRIGSDRGEGCRGRGATTAGGGLSRPPGRCGPRQDERAEEGRGDDPLPRSRPSTSWSPPRSSKSASTFQTRR